MNKPNILWICTDQQRFDTLGCYGNSFVKTPNIDRLAGNGALFENSYCQSTVCSPSRASFLTGRYPRTARVRQNGQSIPSDEVPVTKILADAGYTCGLAGKLHLSACHPSAAPAMEARIQDGYSEFHWSHHSKPDWPTNEYIHWLQNKGMKYETKPVPECSHIEVGPDAEHQQTTWCAEKAIEYIEANASFDRPWLYSVNMFDPHHAFTPPAAGLERYLDRLEDIPLPNYVVGEHQNKPISQQQDHNAAYGWKDYFAYAQMSDSDHRYIKAAYWAMIDLIDEQVGRILEALEKTGQLDNTLVIFMSDHGEMLGDHGIYLKGPHFYDSAVQVPLIVSQPGVVHKNRRISTMVELVDIAPTLLDAAGLPGYPGMQGQSFWPLLTGEQEGLVHRDDVYCEFYNSKKREDPVYATMLRTKRYKMVRYHGESIGELYDLESDSQETDNLWSNELYQSVKLELYERLCDRMAETVDPLPERKAIW